MTSRVELAGLLALVVRDPDEAPLELVPEPGLALLREAGLINDRGVVTEKGEAYICALEAVPLPVQRWCLPADYGRAHEPIEVSCDVTVEPPAKKERKRGNRS